MKDEEDDARPSVEQRLRAEARAHVRERFGNPRGKRWESNFRAAIDCERLGSILFMLTGKPLAGNPALLPARELARYARRLRAALTRERGKSRSGHHSYDANRHIALHLALRQIETIAARQAKPDPERGNSPGRAG